LYVLCINSSFDFSILPKPPLKKRYSFYYENWLRISLVIAFVFSCLLNLQAQTAPNKLWDKTFGGISHDYFESLNQTSDGGYILGGWTDSGIGGDKSQANKGYYDFWIVKLDVSGKKIWDKTFGGNNWDELHSVQQTSDGGYILGGGSYSGISGDKSQPSHGGFDFWVVKLDANGNKLWDKTFGGSYTDKIQSLQQTSDGGYILGGTSDSGISGDKTQASKGRMDYWAVKLDASGKKLWDKTLGGSGDDFLYALQQTTEGGYILGGFSSSGISGDKSQAFRGVWDQWVIKLDANGNKLWDKTFGGNDYDDLFSLQQTSDGGYITGGRSSSGISGDKTQPSRGGTDYWVVKLDASGNKVWDKTFGGNNTDDLHSLQQTSDGGYILGGVSQSDISGDKSQANKGNYDFWIVKLNANGNKTWDKTFGGNSEDWLSSLQQTPDGGYILGGHSGSGNSGDKSQNFQGGLDYWVVKLNPPCVDLKATLTPTCGTSGTNVNVNVTGIQSVNTGSAFWTLTYTINGIRQTATGTTPTFTLAQNVAPGTVYSLVSITSGTCTTRLTTALTVQSIPAAPAVDPGSNCENNSVVLSATGAPTGGSYVWYDVATDGAPLYKSASATFNTPQLNTTTTYYVAAVNNAGCEGPRTPVTATLTNCPPSFIPNIITPNNDGKNDTFKALNLPEGKWSLLIFNRWGINIFEADNYQNNWPNTEMADGTYYYLLKNPETGKQFKGWIEVVH
jgi:gliding motility-associated-like protein